VPRKAAAGKPHSLPDVLRPLGSQLRRLRLERRLSQERLAELAGLNYKHIGRIELAKVEPGADVLVRLARALRVSVGDLFDTITPRDAAASRLSPTEIEGLAAAMAALTTLIDRIVAGQPRPVPQRAPRKARR
jgi:transcriptional regulator with XRE-family HTH domain